MKPILFDEIPHDLQQINQWVTWKYGSDGKRPIFHPYTGAIASVTDKATWGTFEQAKEKQHAPNYDGVGLVLTAELGITVVDIDHCINKAGYLTREAEEVFDYLDTYSEQSPSNTGLHLVLRGVPPGKRARGTVEIYHKDRYISFTGLRVYGNTYGVEERQDELEYLYKTQFSKRTTIATPKRRGKFQARTDNEAITFMLNARNADRIKPLWSGMWQGRYPSQSEADLQLIRYLLYFTGNDTEQTDRLFRRSGLIREKWDTARGSKTYGQLTIERASEGN